MSKSRATTERQLERAKQAVAAREAVLKDKGIESNADTVWRSLKADVRKIDVRLKAIAKIEQREQDLVDRRNAPAAEADAE